MKTIDLISVTFLFTLLFILSCRQSDETINPPTVNNGTEATVASFDEPKDPPKDVPKDRDNWRAATNGNVENNSITKTTVAPSDDPQDPPKDVPKDRDNWKNPPKSGH
ncbi:hypothetical protein EG338_06305 [Kaistella haifensis]|nr:hypothetical protein EG338_06305 [Kaistella haifensis]